MPAPIIGTISHGTLRVQDLLRAFADELDRLEVMSGDIAKAREYARMLDMHHNDVAPQVYLDADDCLQTLSSKLEELAPEDCYFGTHPGDGSDFGFWPVED